MTDSIRLGSIRGVRIGAHWSVLVIAWLLGWGLATRFLPEAAPGYPTAAYWAAGYGVALLFFASILAHELAHAWFAWRAGVKVEGITLWLLGGVARLEGEAPTPGHELRIAASGPAVSAVVGVAGIAASAALDRASVAPLVAEAAAWLGRVNVLLALFNLLPGSPLDGGRIVRAIAWSRGRDRLAASLAAVRLGRIIGFGLIGLGLGELVLGADVGGIWTIVLGFFLVSTATAEGAQELARSTLAEATVADVMTRDVPSVPGGITVDLLVDGVLAPQGRGAAFVMDGGPDPVAVAGLAEAAGLGGRERREKRVREVAVPLAAIPTAAPGDRLVEAFERIAAQAVPGPATAGPDAAGLSGYLLVVEEGRTVGLVTPHDLARSMEARLAGSSDAKVIGSRA